MTIETFRLGHPLGFYVSNHKAYPFNAYYGVLGSLRATPPPRFHHSRVFVYSAKSAPWLSRADEAAYYDAVAEVADKYFVRWDWRADNPPGMMPDWQELAEPAVFRDFGGYYAALASMRRPRGA